MMSFLDHRSKRWSYDGWALRMPGAREPLQWTVSTTRAEVRQLRVVRIKRDPDKIVEMMDEVLGFLKELSALVVEMEAA